MISRKCAVCSNKIEVRSVKSNKIYCSKTCKNSADKSILKLDYQNNPEKYRKKSLTSYYKNHEENKTKARLRAKSSRLENPAQFKNSKLKQAYRITLTEFNAKLTIQNNCCAICFRRFNDAEKELTPFVDHDHRTEKVRELLCLYCNSIVGYSKEDIKVLKSAIKYLKKFKDLS